MAGPQSVSFGDGGELEIALHNVAKTGSALVSNAKERTAGVERLVPHFRARFWRAQLSQHATSTASHGELGSINGSESSQSEFPPLRSSRTLTMGLQDPNAPCDFGRAACTSGEVPAARLCCKSRLGPNGGVRNAGFSSVAIVLVAASAFLLLVLFAILIGCWSVIKLRIAGRKKREWDRDIVEQTPKHSDSIEKYDAADIKVGRLLGTGGFGSVYKGVFQGEAVAVKIIEHDGSVLDQYGEPLGALLSKKLEHPNVVRTFLNQTRGRRHVVWQSPGTNTPALCSPSAQRVGQREIEEATDVDDISYLEWKLQRNDANTPDLHHTWIVMEFCDRGSLHQAIANGVFAREEDGGKPKFAFILLTCLDIARAMTYLHGKGVIHGDLKARNVLLTTHPEDERGFYCKVGDFGLSRVSACSTRIEACTCGTVSHMPPEVLKDGCLTPAVDVYSFGMLLWELATGEVPYRNRHQKDIIVDVVGGKRPPIPESCPHAFASLIQDCWRQERDARPSFKEIVKRLELLDRSVSGRIGVFLTGDPIENAEGEDLSEERPPRSDSLEQKIPLVGGTFNALRLSPEGSARARRGASLSSSKRFLQRLSPNKQASNRDDAVSDASKQSDKLTQLNPASTAEERSEAISPTTKELAPVSTGRETPLTLEDLQLAFRERVQDHQQLSYRCPCRVAPKCSGPSKEPRPRVAISASDHQEDFSTGAAYNNIYANVVDRALIDGGSSERWRYLEEDIVFKKRNQNKTMRKVQQKVYAVDPSDQRLKEVRSSADSSPHSDTQKGNVESSRSYRRLKVVGPIDNSAGAAETKKTQKVSQGGGGEGDDNEPEGQGSAMKLHAITKSMSGETPSSSPLPITCSPFVPDFAADKISNEPFCWSASTINSSLVDLSVTGEEINDSRNHSRH